MLSTPNKISKGIILISDLQFEEWKGVGGGWWSERAGKVLDRSLDQEVLLGPLIFLSHLHYNFFI